MQNPAEYHLYQRCHNLYSDALSYWEKLFDVNKDPLSFLFKISFGFLRLKLIKIASLLLVLSHDSVTLIFIADLIITFDSSLLTEYGPMVILFSPGFMSTIVIYLMAGPVSTLMAQSLPQLWKFDNPNSTAIYEKIGKGSKQLCFFLALNTCIMLMMIFFDTPIGGQNIDIFYSKKIFDEYLPEYSPVLCGLFFAVFPLSGYMMVANIYGLLYVATHQKFQLYFIHNILEKIADGYEGIEDDVLMRDRTYQEKISRQLKNCVQRHQILKMMASRFNEIIFGAAIVLMGHSILSFVSLSFGIIVVGVRQEMYPLSVAAAIIFTGSTTFFVINSGQYLIDESLKLLESAANCPWTSWSLKNRKTLLIFMINAQTPFIIGNPSVFVFEHPFTIQAFKFISSFCTFFVQIVKIRDAKN